MATSLARFNSTPRIPEGHSVTVMRTGGTRFLATKTFVGGDDGSVEPITYKAGMYFRPERVPVGSADELFALLERLEGDPHAFVVGGAPKQGRGRGSIRRTLGEHGDIVDAPRRWVMIDFDGLPMPHGLVPTETPSKAVRHTLSLMGEPWASADFRWQLSSSAGVTADRSKLWAHVWFWLDEPMTGAELMPVLRAANARLGGSLRDVIVDWHMAVANHVHYTSAPRFICMDDPVAIRSGTVRNGGALKTSLLPTASASCPDRRPARRAPPAQPDDAPARTGNVTNLVTHTARAKGIRGDILKLAKHLFDGPVPDGLRNDYVLCYAMAAAAESPSNFWKLVREGAEVLVPGKPDAWLRAKLSSVAERVDRHLAGERVAYGGRLRSPIYTPSIRWYCEYLGLGRTTIRQAGLTVLVDEATRVRNKRAESGATGRRVEANRATLGKVTAAEELLASDLGRVPTDKEVAALVGMSVAKVNKVRNRDISGWGSGLEEGQGCQHFRILSSSVDPDRDMGSHEGKQGETETISREPEGIPRAESATPDQAFGAVPKHVAVRIVPEVVPFPSGSHANGLWGHLPVHRPPDIRRRRQDAPVPISDEHRGMPDFWTSSFEEWVEDQATVRTGTG